MQAGFVDDLGKRLDLLKAQSDYAERFDLGFYLPSLDPAVAQSLAKAAFQDRNSSGHTISKALDRYVDAEATLQLHNNKFQSDSFSLQTAANLYVAAWSEFRTPRPDGLADKNHYISVLAGIDDHLARRELRLPAELLQRYQRDADVMHETAGLVGKAKHPAIQYLDTCRINDHYLNGDYEKNLKIRAVTRGIDEKKEILRVESQSQPSFLRDLFSAVSTRPARRVLTKALDSPNASSESISSAIECYVGVKAWQADLKSSFRSPQYAIFGGYASSMDAAAEHEARRQAVGVLVEHADCRPEKLQLISQTLLPHPKTRAIVFEREDLPRKVRPDMADPRVELRHLNSCGAFTRLDIAYSRLPSLGIVADRVSAGHRPIEPDFDMTAIYAKRPESPMSSTKRPRSSMSSTKWPRRSMSSSSGGGSFNSEKFMEKVHRLASHRAIDIVDLEKTILTTCNQRADSLQKKFPKLLMLRRHAASTQAIGDGFDEKSAVRGDLVSGRAGAERTTRSGRR